MYLACSIYFTWLIIYEYITTQKHAFLLAVSCVLLAVLASIRYQVGTDYNSYFSMFHALLQDPNSYARVEDGWRYITYSLSFLGFNEYGCFVFWGCATMVPLYYGIRNFSPYPLTSIGCFFFLYNISYLYNGMRQCVVMCILVASIGLIKNRKNMQLLFVFLLALSIHRIAIILLPLYFLLKLGRLGNPGYLLLVISFIVGILSLPQTLLTHFGQGIFSEAILFKMQSHFSHYTTPLSIINVLQRMLILIPALIFHKELTTAWKYNDVIINLYFWGCIVYFLFADSSHIAARFNMTTKILDIILVPSFFLIAGEKEKKILLVLILLWCISILCSNFFGSPRHDCYPFQTIFAY